MLIRHLERMVGIQPRARANECHRGDRSNILDPMSALNSARRMLRCFLTLFPGSPLDEACQCIEARKAVLSAREKRSL